MDYTLKERGQRILEACLLETGTNPIVIFENIAKLEHAHDLEEKYTSFTT